MPELNIKAYEQLTQIIQSRRSVFPATYNQTPIEREVTEKIIAAANYAPTHKLTQPWRFVVVTKDSLSEFATVLRDTYKSMIPEEKFSEKKYEDIAAKVNKSGTIIAICMQRHPDKLPEWEEVASVSCAVQNMWLTATALGVGSYWSSPGMIRHLNDWLGLGQDQQCIGLFYMGYSEAILPPSPRTPIEDKTTWK